MKKNDGVVRLFGEELQGYNDIFINRNSISMEEKKKYELDIYNKKFINIFVDSVFINKDANAIDLEIVFSSLSKCDNYMDIINKLLGYFNKKMEGTDKKIAEYLVLYKKLATKLNRSLSIDELNNYFSDKFFCNFSEDKILTKEELLEQVNYYINYKRAFDYYFSSNFGLVIHYARFFDKNNNNSLSITDLVNEGSIGLIKAINKYIPNSNNTFATYATWWVYQSISRSILNKDRSIRVPVHIINHYIEYYKKRELLINEYGEGLSYQDIADKLGMSVEDVSLYESINYYTIALSLDRKTEDTDESGELIDTVACGDKHNTDVIAISNMLKEDIEVLFECLNPREREIILLKYGFIDGKIYTNNEIGKMYGITRERVRQIKDDSLNKIKRRIRKPKYKSLIDYLYH